MPDDCEACHKGDESQMCDSEAKDKDGYHWVCTRLAAHDGDHVACGGATHKLFSWTTEQALPGARR